MDVDNLRVFVAALSAGSFSGAARRLKLTPMAVTRRISALEDELGVRLLHRSTRAISLTPEGDALLPFAIEMVEAEEAAKASLSTDEATGLLRVSSPVTLARKVIVPMLARLMDQHPALRVDLDLNDSIVDIAGSGLDVAIRIAPLKDSALVARRLADNPKHIYAAPAYLARRGTPRHAADLESHECLTFSETTHWIFRDGPSERTIRPSGRFSSSGVDGFLAACIAGLGLTRLSAWDARDELLSGRLVRIDLEDAQPQSLSVWAVYPTRRHVLPKLRVFLDALQAELACWNTTGDLGGER